MAKANKIAIPPKPGTQTWPFRLGDEVEDTISGLKGIAIARIYHITGCDTFAVEPPGEAGKRADGFISDGPRLRCVTSHPDRHIEEVPDIHICLGDEVREMLTDMTGVVTHINVPLFAAVQVHIAPHYDPKAKKLPVGEFFDAHVCEVVTPLDPGTKPAAPTPPERPGSTRMGGGRR